MNARELKAAFKKDHADLFERGLLFCGIFFTPFSEQSEDAEIDLDPVPGNDVITVMRPFIFDSRKTPVTYKGFKVSNQLRSPSEPQHENIFGHDHVPMEFVIDDDEVIYVEDAEAPLRYTTFVDRCEDDIRKALGDPSMTRMDILDALAWGDFKRHCENYRRIKHDRKTGKGITSCGTIEVSITCARGRDQE